jgi:CBS domain-containing protein
MNVKRILATKGFTVITIRPEQAVREAVALLARHNVGALVVIDETGWPAGIISERDIVRAAAGNEQVFSQPVSAVMTRELITVVPQDDLTSVANTMTEKRIRHLPVIDEGKLVGIVSIGDVVKVQRDQYLGEIDTLHSQILGEMLER